MENNDYKEEGVCRLFARGTGNRLTGKNKKRPYMKEREIAIFSEILQRNRPGKVLEYGCGLSTVHYPELLAEGARWVSVEHDKEWHDMVKSQIGGNVDLHLVAPDNKEFASEGGKQDFASYIKKGVQNAPFDLILVDGMARTGCIDELFDSLTPDGLMIVHDANRPHYRDSMKKYCYVTIFEDYRKTAGGMAFVSNSHPADYYFDVKRHAKIWKTMAFWGNFFKFKFLMGKKGKTFRLVELNAQ